VLLNVFVQIVTFFFFLGFFNESSKEQHLFEIETFLANLSNVIFDQFMHTKKSITFCF